MDGWQIKSTCMKGNWLYVLAKNPESEEAIRAFGVQLPDGYWKSVVSESFGAFAFDQAVSALQAGVWTVHCGRMRSACRRSVHEFHSYRIPMTDPESMLWRSWFSLLTRPGIQVDVPQGDASQCRLLSRTGDFTNRIAFLHQQTIVVRDDFETEKTSGAVPLDEQTSSNDRPLQTRAKTLEQAELEAAIEESLRACSGKMAASNATGDEQRAGEVGTEQKAEQFYGVLDYTDYFDPDKYDDSTDSSSGDWAEENGSTLSDSEEVAQAEEGAENTATRTPAACDQQLVPEPPPAVQTVAQPTAQSEADWETRLREQQANAEKIQTELHSRIRKLEKQVTDQDAKLATAVDENSALLSKVAHLESKLEERENEAKAAADRQKALVEQRSVLKQQIKDLKSTLFKEQTCSSSLRRQVEELEQKVHDLNEKAVERKRVLAAVRQKNAASKAEKKQLQLDAEMAGLKFALEQQKQAGEAAAAEKLSVVNKISTT
ncbi:hypothetical protein M3Y99_00687300 [Aphelenchoides fujianensis]|nr:hypothetical protein M3Y99_00687300 [Aphelenchoides fujianensis]